VIKNSTNTATPIKGKSSFTTSLSFSLPTAQPVARPVPTGGVSNPTRPAKTNTPDKCRGSTPKGNRIWETTGEKIIIIACGSRRVHKSESGSIFDSFACSACCGC
jgi:hypothetical protein